MVDKVLTPSAVLDPPLVPFAVLDQSLTPMIDKVDVGLKRRREELELDTMEMENIDSRHRDDDCRQSQGARNGTRQSQKHCKRLPPDLQ